MRPFAIIMIVGLLAGCANFGYIPPKDSVQEYAGCTVVDYVAADGSTVAWKDCKDKSMVRAAMTMPSGLSFKYEADDVTGTEAMRLRAEVHRALIGAGVTASTDAVDAVIRALRPERVLVP